MGGQKEGRKLGRLVSVVALLIVLGSVICPARGRAQVPAISPDATLGTAVSNTGAAFTISGGTVRGQNLFHSFNRFSVPTSGSATFIGPGATENIISRVTGGAQSTIDGLISSRGSMPGANFFLINPSGVVFTSGARVDVGGAFRVSTADNIRLADGTIFAATPAPGDGALLTSAPPQAFGFLRDAPNPITVSGAQWAGTSGQALSFVGGDVRVDGSAILLAPGGTVDIASVASPGNAILGPAGVDLGSFARLGQVSITDGAFIAAHGSLTGGGTIHIQSGRLIVDRATLAVNTLNVDAASRGIDLRATDSITLRNGALVLTESRGLGDAGGISIATPELLVANGSAVTSRTIGSSLGRTGDITIDVGRAEIDNARISTTAGVLNTDGTGNVTIVASDTITLSGATAEIASVNESTDADVLGGDISISGRNVILRDGARIRSGDTVAGEGGRRLSVTATDSIVISDLAGIASHASFSGDGGLVEISAPRLVVDNGFINTSTLGGRSGGRVLIDVGTASLLNGAQIASGSLRDATGAGGSINLTATTSVSMSGRGDVGGITFTLNPSSGLISTASGSGAAGEITVNTPRLTLGNQSTISVQTSGAATAIGGRILLNAPQIDLRGGGTVNSGTTGAGAGGNIEVRGDRITLANAGTGFFSDATAGGAGGNIAVNGQDVTVQGGATLSATSSGTGNAGNVSLVIGNSLILDGGVIATGATLADGGNISITTTGSLVHLTNAQITTSVQSGLGGGGNISIGSTSHPVEFIVLQGSEIRADAFGGPGGNVQILADVFLTDGSIVSASSALGVPGTISIEANVTDVSGGLAQLPESILQAASLLRAACTARLAGGQSSSLVVAGREGVPPEPGAMLSSSLVAEAPGLLLSLLDDDADGGHSLPGVALWGPPVPCSR